MKQRNTVIDFAKGATILMMLWAHLHLDSNFINSFHMPLFFILSGYFFKEGSLKKLVIRRAKGLLIPYFIMEAIKFFGILLLQWLREGTIDLTLEDLPSKIIPIFLATDPCISWFCFVLFAVNILYALINMAVHGHYILTAIIASGCSYIGYYFSNSPYWDFKIFRWDLVLFVIPFFAAGHLYHLYKDKIPKKLKYIAIIPAIIIWAADLYFTDSFSIGFGMFDPYPLSAIGAICATFVMMMLYTALDKIPVLNNIMRFFGTNTLVVMCFATFVTDVMRWIEDDYLGNVFLSFALQVSLCAVLIFLWMGLKYIFGYSVYTPSSYKKPDNN